VGVLFKLVTKNELFAGASKFDVGDFDGLVRSSHLFNGTRVCIARRENLRDRLPDGPRMLAEPMVVVSAFVLVGQRLAHGMQTGVALELVRLKLLPGTNQRGDIGDFDPLFGFMAHLDVVLHGSQPAGLN